MSRGLLLLVAGYLTLTVMASATWSVAASGPSQSPMAMVPAHASPIGEPVAMVQEYCVTCHNPRAKAGGLVLDPAGLAQVGSDAEIWERVVKKMRAGLMPPAGRPRPDRQAYDGWRVWLETELDRAAIADPNPGRSATFHRLNRVEYRNAVRDLLALDLEVDEWLPVDPASYGFDNIGDALGMSSSLLERYLSVAERISALAVGNPAVDSSVETYVVASDITQRDRLEGLPFGTRGGTLIQHYFPVDGEYRIQLRLARNFNTRIVGLNEPHEMEITLDGARVARFTVGGKERQRDGGDLYETGESDDRLNVSVPVKAGPRKVGVAFLRRSSVQYEDPTMPLLRDYPGASAQQGQPALSTVQIGGPYGAATAEETPSRRRIFSCHPATGAVEADCAKAIMSRLARHAYRRPVTTADLDLLAQFYEQGHAVGGFERGIEEAITRLLLSPSFLFRVELDPTDVVPGGVYSISELMLASRLSFFLWSSIPDDELLGLAERGQLRAPGVLEAQVRRMLADSRSMALARNFMGQWLELRKVADVNPTQRLFPDFDGNLRNAFQRETELFIDSIIREDRSVVDLLGANYTFVNERLARHYGIPNVYGSHFRRVTLDDPLRGGVLGHGSLLTLTSNETRTSPVRRGVYILENLLGVEPPAPPANVPALPEDPTRAGQELSMREKMVQHRENPVCASCHAMMDPLGLALEAFDATGKAVVSKDPMDLSGVLPDGTEFDGPAGLRQVLVGRSEEFVTTMTERLLTYALGRGVESYDMPVVRRITRTAAADDYRFSALVLGIVSSDPFQMRRAQASATDAAGVARR